MYFGATKMHRSFASLQDDTQNRASGPLQSNRPICVTHYTSSSRQSG